MKKPGIPFVSVIIPIFNTEEFLQECLDSATHQTIMNIEIICIDDGSTDSCSTILEEYKKKDSRIVVITQENKGLAAARNRGMKNAKGKYIFFLDSDDYVDSETLEKSVHLAEEHDLDAVVFSFEQFADSDELLQIHPSHINTMKTPMRIYSGPEYMRVAKKNGAYSSGVWSAVWRHSFLEEKDLWFKEGILHEDMRFSFRAYMAAERVMVIPERLYHYRARQGSITAKPISSENVIGSFKCAKGILKYALADKYEPDREHEILRAYREQCDYTCSLFSAASTEEQEKAIPSREVEQELFRQVNALHRVDRLQNTISEQIKEIGKLLDVLDEQQEENSRLHKALNTQETDARSLQSAFIAQQEETQKLLEELHTQNLESESLRNELYRTRASWTYRIGRAVTWLPRKIQDGCVSAGRRGRSGDKKH